MPVITNPLNPSNTDHSHDIVTATTNGLMSSADKTKLDGIAAGAQVNTVTSVASKTGAVTLVKADVGLGNVDNTADASKPVATTSTNGLMSAADKTKLDDLRGINLWINSDYRNPINARGAASITGGGYTVDRTKLLTNASGLVTSYAVQSGGGMRWTITNAGSGGTYWALGQSVEAPARLITRGDRVSGWVAQTIRVKTNKACTLKLFGASANPETAISGDEAWHDIDVTGQLLSGVTEFVPQVLRSAVPVVGDYIEIDYAGLWAGKQPLVWIAPDPQQEPARCQRYWCKSYDLAIAAAAQTPNGVVQFSLGQQATASFYPSFPTRFSVDMRRSPTVTIYDYLGNAGKISLATSGGGSTHNITPYQVLVSHKGILVQALADNATYSGMLYHYTADAEI